MVLLPDKSRGVSAVTAASVAPEVKITWSGPAPASAATSPRAASIAARAWRPSAWTEDGLPVCATTLSMACRAAPKRGVLALASKYMRCLFAKTSDHFSLKALKFPDRLVFNAPCETVGAADPVLNNSKLGSR